MTVVDLEAGPLSLRISTRGGLLLGFWRDLDGERVPLLRPSVPQDVDALGSACYPLVPFGNRVKGNAFSFEEKRLSTTAKYRLGQALSCTARAGRLIGRSYNRPPASVEMSFTHGRRRHAVCLQGMPAFSIDEAGLTMTLMVENRGEGPMPFGLGWHPYFR
jgi:aldose 1-epimerase